MSGHETPPIMRHDALVPLNRDHCVGLVRGNRLMKAVFKGRVARHKALADFLEAWRTEIEPHFRDEERLLTPLITDEVDRQRLRDEHAAIERAAKEAVIKRRAVDPDPDFVECLGRDRVAQSARGRCGSSYAPEQSSCAGRARGEATTTRCHHYCDPADAWA